MFVTPFFNGVCVYYATIPQGIHLTLGNIGKESRNKILEFVQVSFRGNVGHCIQQLKLCYLRI